MRLVSIITATLLQMECIAISPTEKKLVCPDSWEYLETGNHCLLKVAERNTFSNMLRICGNKSSGTFKVGLVTLLGMNAQKEFCNAIKKLGFSWLWIGATDHEKEGIFKWVSNGQSVMNYFDENEYKTMWTAGQPNDDGITHQDCIAIRTYSCEWNDHFCSTYNYGLCEIYEANTCKRDNGHCEQLCILTGPHSRRCACKEGFQLVDEVFCRDIDECNTLSKGGCRNSDCANHYGSWNCLCPINDNTSKISQLECEELNPCRLGNGGCNHVCRFKKGSSHCECLEGYMRNSTKTCVYIEKERYLGVYLLMAAASFVLSSIFIILVLGYVVKEKKNRELEQAAMEEEIKKKEEEEKKRIQEQEAREWEIYYGWWDDYDNLTSHESSTDPVDFHHLDNTTTKHSYNKSKEESIRSYSLMNPIDETFKKYSSYRPRDETPKKTYKPMDETPKKTYMPRDETPKKTYMPMDDNPINDFRRGTNL